MTDYDKPAFAQAMARLGVALREKDPDAVRLRVYFESLKDLDVELLVAAAEELAKRAEWFPKTSEWREATVRLDRERTECQRAALRGRLVPLCADCGDTGWARDEASNRVHRCSCALTRRLEVLGRRPMPAMPELPPSSSAQLAAVEAKAAIAVKGMP